jgi:hypothetical protein
VFTPNGQLIVSENQPHNGTDTSSISSYAINANGSLTTISQSLPTFGNGNCWNAITQMASGYRSIMPALSPWQGSQFLRAER